MSEVRLERWSDADAALLAELNGDPEQMAHVGGAESPEKIAERQERYAADPRQFVVVDEQDRRTGWVGFWEREWREETVFEIGWSIARPFQGRGLATKGTIAALEQAKAQGTIVAVHAFPGVENEPSNRVCASAGFELVQARLAFEYPPGHTMRCNDWRFTLAEQA
jgi:RimJ/RimL family protein N-acetyltransferase